jgi:hypothetical protein
MQLGFTTRHGRDKQALNFAILHLQGMDFTCNMADSLITRFDLVQIKAHIPMTNALRFGTQRNCNMDTVRVTNVFQQVVEERFSNLIQDKGMFIRPVSRDDFFVLQLMALDQLCNHLLDL